MTEPKYKTDPRFMRIEQHLDHYADTLLRSPGPNDTAWCLVQNLLREYSEATARPAYGTYRDWCELWDHAAGLLLDRMPVTFPEYPCRPAERQKLITDGHEFVCEVICCNLQFQDVDPSSPKYLLQDNLETWARHNLWFHGPDMKVRLQHAFADYLEGVRRSPLVGEAHDYMTIFQSAAEAWYLDKVRGINGATRRSYDTEYETAWGALCQEFFLRLRDAAGALKALESVNAENNS